MTQLTIIQDACVQLGIAAPIAVFGSSDIQILQLQSLLNMAGRNLATRSNWTALAQTTTFTTVAAQSQGALQTIAPYCRFIVNDTIFNRTLRRPVFGPLTPQVWQQRLALIYTGPWNQFRAQGGLILFLPNPVAGQACAFEYQTKAWVTDLTGTILQMGFLTDTDISLLDEDLLLLSLLWRWKHSKGLDFKVEQQEYEMRLVDALARDGSKPVLNMGCPAYDFPPGIMVPLGSWPT